MESTTLKDALTDAVRYWEPRRLIYNGALALVVVAYFWIGFPGSKQRLNADLALVVFLLAVVANVAYCAAYLADVFMQFSGFREVWQRVRWVVLVIGTLFAAVITRFIAMGMFVGN